MYNAYMHKYANVCVFLWLTELSFFHILYHLTTRLYSAREKLNLDYIISIYQTTYILKYVSTS